MNATFYHLLQLLYLMMPIYVANMAPPFIQFWHGWNRPISERHLGSHKTVLGFIAGIVAATACANLQAYISWSGSLIRDDDWLRLGIAAGTGAMAGDSVKSLFKRRMGIAPGQSWKPWDQWDFVIGGLGMVLPWLRLSWTDLAWIFGFTFLAAIAVNHLAYRAGIRDTKW